MSDFYKKYYSDKLKEIRPWLDNFVNVNDRQDCTFFGNGISTELPILLKPQILGITYPLETIEISFDLNTYTGQECSAVTVEYSTNLVDWTEVVIDCESPQSFYIGNVSGTYYFRLYQIDTYGRIGPYSF